MKSLHWYSPLKKSKEDIYFNSHYGNISIVPQYWLHKHMKKMLFAYRSTYFNRSAPKFSAKWTRSVMLLSSNPAAFARAKAMICSSCNAFNRASIALMSSLLYIWINKDGVFTFSKCQTCNQFGKQKKNSEITPDFWGSESRQGNFGK